MQRLVLYTTPTCPHCHRAKKFLNGKGIEYYEVNVALDREGLSEMRRKSGQMGVPVLDMKGKIVIGFSKEKIETALREMEERERNQALIDNAALNKESPVLPSDS